MKTYDYIQGVPRRGNEDPHGCIRVWFAPEYEEIYINDRLIRSIIPGTYVAVYDPVGIDKDKKKLLIDILIIVYLLLKCLENVMDLNLNYVLHIMDVLKDQKKLMKVYRLCNGIIVLVLDLWK